MMDEKNEIGRDADPIDAPAATTPPAHSAAPLAYTNLRDRPDNRFTGWVVLGALLTWGGLFGIQVCWWIFCNLDLVGGSAGPLQWKVPTLVTAGALGLLFGIGLIATRVQMRRPFLIGCVSGFCLMVLTDGICFMGKW